MITKQYTLVQNEEYRKNLFLYQWMFIGIVMLFIWLFSFVLLPTKFVVSVATISCMKIIQEATVTLNRVMSKFKRINITTISFSLPFLFFNIYIINSIEDFFHYWIVALFISVFIGIISLKQELKYLISIDKYFIFLKQNFKILIIESLSFSFLHFVNFFISSSDKIILGNYISSDELGKYQLSENISNALSIAVASIFFIITPFVYRKLSSREWTYSYFISVGYKISAIIILIYCICFYPIILIIESFFPLYAGIKLIAFLLMISKLLASFCSIPLSIYIVSSKELNYVKHLFIVALVNILVFFILSNTIENKLLLSVYFPLVLILTYMTFLVQMAYSCRQFDSQLIN